MKTNLYRIYHDSSHFVGIKYIKTHNNEPTLFDEPTLKDYTSEYCMTYGKPKIQNHEKHETDIDKILKEAYLKCLEFKKKDRLQGMLDYLEEHHYILPKEMIESYLSKQYKNLYSRIDRFKKKALNNEWNYFVTITYDDKKHDEISFKEKLKKCLANLHTRYGYKYMGVFERSKTGRLHFHALMFIPKGQLKGEIREVKDYSTSDKKMRTAYVNSFFEKRFGRNDFVKINTKELMNDRTIEYLLKYISKSDEPIFYSRGIATFLFVELPEDEIVTQFGNMLIKYVLFDDILEDHATLQMRC